MKQTTPIGTDFSKNLQIRSPDGGEYSAAEVM